jgi:hypothetical protein
MWTENVTWFSNEEGRKGRIEAGEFADLIVPDRDYLSCPETDIPDTTSLLTMVGGKIVFAAGPFAEFDSPVPPAMPDWSPVRKYGGYAAWGAAQRSGGAPLQRAAAQLCGCASACGVHGHAHAWARDIPASDLKSFWGALGCSCWAV